MSRISAFVLLAVLLLVACAAPASPPETTGQGTTPTVTVYRAPT